jgi:hypothetical protein
MTRKWTFMVYMAGDNGKVFAGPSGKEQILAPMESAGRDDLAEMAKVGSNDDLAIVVQFDTLSDTDFTQRLYITEEVEAVEQIPETNCGNPQSLADFVTWAMSGYPAERYALVLWNHGGGWKEEDIYDKYRGVRGGLGRRLSGSLFRTTAVELMSIEDEKTRWICADDSSMDFLDNRDLSKALKTAQDETGQRLSLIGMDACLMAMLEVAYQVRHFADCLVGSQEAEPMAGWPYETVLGALIKDPEMSAHQFGQVIVQEYGRYHKSQTRGGGGRITQSAIDLAQVEATYELVDQLSSTLIEGHSEIYIRDILLRRVLKRVERFRDKDYIDLRHFASLLAGGYRGKNETIREYANQLCDHLKVGQKQGPILANAHGLRHKEAHGLSIYFPLWGCSSYYTPSHLEFANNQWRQLIHAANEVSSTAKETPL